MTSSALRAHSRLMLPADEPFEALYREHFDALWRMARGLGVDSSLIDDVVQETFLIAFRKLDGFEGRSSIKTWITGILVRVAAKARRRRRPDSLGERSLEDPRPSPAELAIAGQAQGILERLLTKLSEKNRTVWVLAELEQLSATQIGEALGISSNTASSRLRLARKQLERELRRLEAQGNLP